MQTYAYGYPRLGENREYKKTLERYFKGELSDSELENDLESLQASILHTYQSYVDDYPVGEMTGYDTMLDTAIMLGIYQPTSKQEYYELCRGTHALPMIKWFNTNYHYLVPDLGEVPPLEKVPVWNKPLQYWERHKAGNPYLIGPLTFLKLSHGHEPANEPELLLELAKRYRQVISELPRVHIDEPALSLELSDHTFDIVEQAYRIMAESGTGIHLFTYYGSPDRLQRLSEFPVSAIGLDFVHDSSTLPALLEAGFPADKTLIAGVVDGRNVWRTNIPKTLDLIQRIRKVTDQLVISNAGPLFHLPVSTSLEPQEAPLLPHLAFAKERLEELRHLAECVRGEATPLPFREGAHPSKPTVQEKLKLLTQEDASRPFSAADRAQVQREELGLPLFPSTTIGSFPQTAEVRKMRAKFRKNEITAEEYDTFIKKNIAELIRFQETVDLDVLVHGEYERTDMVEFFAQRIDGIATTTAGWVISYGSRVYRPPIIYGDVSRPSPMTVEEIAYAQSLTEKPVKGMLTGPITILSWSFSRTDIPQDQIANQLALCLRDEIQDYVKAGVRIVQIDEPAYREKAPLKQRDWEHYFSWASRAFNIAATADEHTQIHTHMCYSSFEEIIDHILKLNFDVISIEASRSDTGILRGFHRGKFDRQIGLGVWDIHSPAVPEVEEMQHVIQQALEVFDREQIWINPDCGLKTRQWPETEASLCNMVSAAKDAREVMAPSGA